MTSDKPTQPGSGASESHSGAVKRASNASADHVRASFYSHHQLHQQQQPAFSPIHGLSAAIAPHDSDGSNASRPQHGSVAVHGGGQRSRYASGDSSIYDSTWFSSSSSSLMSPASPTNEAGYYSSGSAGDVPMLPYPPHYYQPDPRQYRFYGHQAPDGGHQGWSGKPPMVHFGQPVMPFDWGAGGPHVFGETTVDPKALLSGERAPSAPPHFDRGQSTRGATPGHALKPMSAPSLDSLGQLETQGQGDEEMSGDESGNVETKPSTIVGGLNASSKRKVKRLAVKMPTAMPGEDDADESEFADTRAFDVGMNIRYRRDDRLASERKRRDALSLAFIEIRGLLPPEIQKLPKSRVLEYAAGALKQARADAEHWKKEFDALLEATAGQVEDHTSATGAASSGMPLGQNGTHAADPRGTSVRARGRSRAKRS